MKDQEELEELRRLLMEDQSKLGFMGKYGKLLANPYGYISAPRRVVVAGADVATVPPAVLKGLVKHKLTDAGLEAFLADWQKTGQNICSA